MKRAVLPVAALLLGCTSLPAAHSSDPAAGAHGVGGSLLAPDLAPAPTPRADQPQVGSPGAAKRPDGLAKVCGDPRLVGTRIAAITSSNPSCGIAEPVRITAVAGVPLSAPIRVNCTAAKRFADWVEAGPKPDARRMLGSPLGSLHTVASYACRTRNHRAGAKISEHAKGNAIDVAGFTLSDGRKLTVSKHWRAGGNAQRFMRNAWKTACGPFGTVLGPGSDRFHQDHFHFDVAKYRSGPYCR